MILNPFPPTERKSELKPTFIEDTSRVSANKSPSLIEVNNYSDNLKKFLANGELVQSTKNKNSSTKRAFHKRTNSEQIFMNFQTY